MNILDVRFVRTPDCGGWHRDPDPLCVLPMDPAEVPRDRDILFLPDQGEQRWRVDLVERDLRRVVLGDPVRREVAVWVSAA